MKRVILFLLTNIAVIPVLLISTRILGIDRFLSCHGRNMVMLLAFAALPGFEGSLYSTGDVQNHAEWRAGAQVEVPCF